MQIEAVAESKLVSMTEAQVAAWRRRQRAHVVEHRGRFWEQVRYGFYQPVHPIARLSIAEATPPARLCWGFRAAIHECDAADANGTIPVYLLVDVRDGYVRRLTSSRRNQLKQCGKQVEIVQLTDTALLQAQGYEVVVSAVNRTKHEAPPTRDEYLARVAASVYCEHQTVLAGLIGGKLGGYLAGYAVDGTAYVQSIYIATDALPTNVGTGLIVEFVQACTRLRHIHEIVYGLHTREDQALGFFKRGVGFPVVHVPAKVSINPLLGKMIRWRYPDKYYRLTGRD